MSETCVSTCVKDCSRNCFVRDLEPSYYVGLFPSSPFAFSVEETFTIKLSVVASSSRLTAPFATSKKKFPAGKTNRKYAQRPAAWVFPSLRGGLIFFFYLRSFDILFVTAKISQKNIYKETFGNKYEFLLLSLNYVSNQYIHIYRVF